MGLTDNWDLNPLIQTLILDPSNAFFNGADNKNYIGWPSIVGGGGGGEGGGIAD